ETGRGGGAGQQANQLRCADSNLGGRDSKKFDESDGSRVDRSDEIQRAVSKIREPEQAPGLGPRPGDRKLAGKKTGLPAFIVRPIRGCPVDRTIVASP